ncbi:HAD family hydrolase [Pelagicoccus sp. SDUM812003]|uniref:HAD family hydrolase n=1 Tax=Pelagicoccus sp. SDUM812003 TaxID=3041267 RepID=UPI00280D9E9B|nr:HAD family hydrolase [Pelagicoccus sp. SDUM812003]MDQ8202831.1 HAD family hydrolase [Pelagicoccus sp. SDUM812003]
MSQASQTPPLPIKAVAIDLDGTLLAPDLSISDANRAAIEQLHAQGVHIILASGRHYLSMLPHARKLPQIEYMVSAQGGYASDIENTHTIFESHLHADDATRALEFGLKNELAIAIYTVSGIYTLSEGPWIDYYSDLAGIRPTLTTPEEVVKEAIFKVVYFDTDERLDELEKDPFLKESKLYTVRSLKNIFEQANPKTSKRSALEALVKHLGIDPEQLAAFGDANNDIPMFELAGFSVAMDHAWPAAREAATIVAPEGDPAESFARGVAAMRKHFSKP